MIRTQGESDATAHPRGFEEDGARGKCKEAIGTATEFIFSAKDTISSALQAVPQAALAWADVCIALENPIAATEANRNGINDDKKRIEQTKGGLLQESYSWVLDNLDYQQWRDTEESRLLWIKGDPGKGKTMLLCGIIPLEGPNAWIALSDMLVAILQDPMQKSTYLVVDALDECIDDLQKLQEFIVQTSSTTTRAKRIVSSRNWSQIKERLRRAEQKVKLSLELNAESISSDVDIYIEKRIRQLSDLKGYDEETWKSVRDYLSNNANDTFLWVALVCQNLEKYPQWKPGRWRCLPLKQILAAMTIVYRPVALRELCYLINIPKELSDDIDSLKEVVALCGSFLTIRYGTIYFVHQSAKDHLTKNEAALSAFFPTGRGEVHHTIFSLSLQATNTTLRKNIHALPFLGSLIENGISIPDPDPISALRYSCVHWVDHFCEANADGSSAARRTDFEDDGEVSVFLRKHFLHWL
ncbi:wd40 repeat [Trichoderma arundinaceum]|uniref:Wd40 repeat n=1 Tax=Trichoderma arundinaceum TaxID=490622 RepID=A0A395NHW5_TRIAR|nr:wd40 repeat [Trichoderma arundinaceum]